MNGGVEEIKSHVQKIEALAEQNFRNSQRQKTLLSFFGSKMLVMPRALLQASKCKLTSVINFNLTVIGYNN